MKGCFDDMKEYKYVEIKFEAKGVLFHSASEPKEIINKYAKEGYSYVGFIPTLMYTVNS